MLPSIERLVRSLPIGVLRQGLYPEPVAPPLNGQKRNSRAGEPGAVSAALAHPFPGARVKVEAGAKRPPRSRAG